MTYQQRIAVPLAAPVRTDRSDGAAAAGLALLSAALFVLSTRHGIGVLPDSTRYLNMAPQPWDAPLYPAALYLVGLFGPDRVESAWVLGLLLCALNTVLAWHILRQATGRPGYAAMGTALIVIAPQTTGLYALAMSEPLFLTMIFAALLALLRYWRHGDRRWLAAAGIAVGLASLARFTGPALGAAIALTLLADPRFALARRSADVLLFAAPAAVLFLGWAGLSEILAGRSTGRPLEWLGNMGAEEWRVSLDALNAWLVPDQVPFALRTALFLAAFAAAAVLLAGHGRRMLARAKEGEVAGGMLAVPLGLFFFTYLAFMILATALEANLNLNGRYAYPIYCTSVMAVTVALAASHGAQGAHGAGRRLCLGLIGLGCLMLASHALRTAVRTVQAHEQGLGYAAPAWTGSPTLAAVQRLPAGARLYSNGPDAIGYVLRRPARSIPMPFGLRTGRDDPHFPYAAQRARLRADLVRGGAYVVFLNGIDWRFYMAREADLVRGLDLVLVDRQADGRIYTGRRAATTANTAAKESVQ